MPTTPIPRPVTALSPHDFLQASSPRTVQWDPLFTTMEAAELTRHFVDHCSGFFDFSDIYRHFAYEVPLKARRNATLANAMLALAARHRSRTQAYDPYVAHRYYHDCLQTLIPRLGDSTAVNDDELLAAIVILRLLEEMDVPIVGTDPQGHLLGTQAIIVASQSQSPSPITPLRKACYWAAFRQEIYMSLTSHRPFKLRLPEMASSLNSSDDWTWALQATYQCGKVQEFVFGEEAANAVQYAQLLREIESWKINRPIGFDPVFYEAGGIAGSFPAIYLHMDYHVMAWQYIVMAHLLLVVHQRLPRVGPFHRQALRDMENAARDDVRMICGVALSNPQTPPANLVACMAIAMFGDRFESRPEQALLRDILIRTEITTGWPTATARQQLEECWGWQENDEITPS